jgi:hypothetical protein
MKVEAPASLFLVLRAERPFYCPFKMTLKPAEFGECETAKTD